MSNRSDVAPSTLPVSISSDGVRVEYLDGREAVYRGPIREAEAEVRCQPGKDVHVLVTDPGGGRGVVVYVNDRRTHDDILESTGVGRVFLAPDQELEVFPGVSARADGYAIVVEANPEVAGGRVFVFEEDELGERAYELS